MRPQSQPPIHSTAASGVSYFPQRPLSAPEAIVSNIAGSAARLQLAAPCSSIQRVDLEAVASPSDFLTANEELLPCDPRPFLEQHNRGVDAVHDWLNNASLSEQMQTCVQKLLPDGAQGGVEKIVLKHCEKLFNTTSIFLASRILIRKIEALNERTDAQELQDLNTMFSKLIFFIRENYAHEFSMHKFWVAYSIVVQKTLFAAVDGKKGDFLFTVNNFNELICGDPLNRGVLDWFNVSESLQLASCYNEIAERSFVNGINVMFSNILSKKLDLIPAFRIPEVRVVTPSKQVFDVIIYYPWAADLELIINIFSMFEKCDSIFKKCSPELLTLETLDFNTFRENTFLNELLDLLPSENKELLFIKVLFYLSQDVYLKMGYIIHSNKMANISESLWKVNPRKKEEHLALVKDRTEARLGPGIVLDEITKKRFDASTLQKIEEQYEAIREKFESVTKSCEKTLFKIIQQEDQKKVI